MGVCDSVVCQMRKRLCLDAMMPCWATQNASVLAQSARRCGDNLPDRLHKQARWCAHLCRNWMNRGKHLRLPAHVLQQWQVVALQAGHIQQASLPWNNETMVLALWVLVVHNKHMLVVHHLQQPHRLQHA